MFDESPQQCFKSFVWGNKQVIGAGATSLVYKAICLETGNYVAVKYFNDAAKSRSNVLQSRELDLLLKINHENVVKLIDKDEQNDLKYSLKLLVMEYCNGGSLSSIIEQPENIYGLQQSEFLLVLRHITRGMNELHKLKIVHRDIKPNNILLQILPTGEHVYKLTDFGAARQVEMEDDQFTSICGTEEYLFPDVYERALINRNIQKSFRAGIDLWSLGVSLYHVATGLLPFRPIGGRHNRETMIKITKDKPSGAISGIQNIYDSQIEYSSSLPDTCQLSKNLQVVLVPMLAGLMENNYEAMWSFQKFFEHSTQICDLTFVNILNLDTCQIIELPFEPVQKLAELKEKIEMETFIDKNSQLLIYNNLLLDSLVTEQQTIETYPTIDKEHPLVLFSLNNTLSCDNNNIIKSIPNLRCKNSPKQTNEIIYWAKETCGSIFYIKREVYMITMIIELLKLSAIAFKSYMPEMKLKQQNLLYQFHSRIKSLETKLDITNKLKSCLSKSKSVSIPVSHNSNSSQEITEEEQFRSMKDDIEKFKVAINSYETEINILTEKINSTQDLEFFVQNSYLTSKWKTEMDELANSSKQIYEDLVSQKKEIRSKLEQERFEKSKFTEIKLKQEYNLKDIAVKLYQETIIVHFVDYYSRFEKWMSDLIKLHNELMSVQQKLVECEKALNSPVDCENHLDTRINRMMNLILENSNNTVDLTRNAMFYSNDQMAQASNSKNNSLKNSKNSLHVNSDNISQNNRQNIGTDSNNNRIIDVGNLGNIDSIIKSVKNFKDQAIVIEKALDDNAAYLRHLQDQFNKQQINGN